MNKLLTKIVGAALGLTMAIGVGVAVASNSEAVPVHATTIGTTYTISSTAATSITNNGMYVLKSNADANGFSGTIATSSNWASTTTTPSSYFILKAVGSTSSFTLQDYDGTNGYIYCSAAKKISWHASNKTTFKLMNGKKTTSISNAVGNDTVGTLQYNSSGGFRPYTSSTGPDAQLFAVSQASVAAYVAGNSSVDVNSEYTATVKKTSDDSTVSGTITYVYTPSEGAVLSSPTPDAQGKGTNTTGKFTASHSGKVTISATLLGYTITSNTVTVNSSDPYINLTLTSGENAYTGQTVNITSEYGNGVTGLTWTVQSGSISGAATTSNSGYSAKISNTAGTLTIRATDTGSALYNEVSVTVTKTAFTTSPAASASVAEGKTTTLSAVLNSGGTINWDSDDHSVAIVSAGVVTGVAAGTATITAQSADDTSVTATCTVTITEAPLADILTSSVIPAAAVGSSTSAWGTASTFSDYTGAIYTGRFMGVSSSSFIGRLNDSVNGYIYTSTVPSKLKLKSVSIDSMTASKTVGVYAQSGAYTAAPSDKSTALGTLTSTSLTYEFAENSNYNAICLRGHTSATEIGVVTIEYEALSTLDSVTTSGQNTSFTAGVKFSYGGTLTAHYTAGKADAAVTPASYKIGASGIDPTTAGTAITTSTTLTKAEHDGKYIYVIYTEDDITKWASYQITVNYAAVTSVEIDTHAAGIGLGETYNVTSVGVTINTEYANQGYEWLVSANTVGDEYYFENNELLAGDTPGTITLRCRSTADNSKYDELVVTVSGDPVVDIIPASVSGYVGKSVDVDFTYGNIDNVELIDFASSNPSVLTVVEHIEDSGEGAVTINFVGAGNATLSVSYDGGSTLDSITVTVSADSVTALTWSAPTIKVYSGATTTVSDASSWNVHYTMASGDEDNLSYGEYTLKLGGSTITLPHTWDASEDGKVLSIEYGGFASPTTSTVDVTQSLRPVNAPVAGEKSTKTWTATAAANFGSTIKNVKDTDSGSVTFNNGSTMSYERTLEYVASGKADYLAFSSNYIQFGSSNALEKLVLTAATSGTVTSVVVNCWAKDGGSNISVTVGGNAFDTSKACPSAGAEVTFNGSATGTVVITMEKSTKTAGLAQYIKSVAITTAEDSGETTNIANVAGHEAAQKAVVAFAKAMNAAFDNTANCVDGVADAWETASSAYSSNITDNASLSADEKAYAKNLIKYASAQYTEHTDNDYSYCLERAMATYEACIQKHGQTAFMSDVRSVSLSPRITPLSIINGNGNTVAIIVIISMISVTAIGGYFFLRKRKEN